MPDINAIKQFKEVLKSLGDEPAILAERSEVIEDIPLPEEGLPEDLSALLGTTDTDSAPDSPDISGEEKIPEKTDELGNIEDFPAPPPDTGDPGSTGGSLPPLDEELSFPGDVLSSFDEMSTPPDDKLPPFDEVITPPEDELPPLDEVTTPPGDELPPLDEVTTPPGDELPPLDEVTTPPGDELPPLDEVTTPPGDELPPLDEELHSFSDDNGTPGEPGLMESGASMDDLSALLGDIDSIADSIPPPVDTSNEEEDEFTLPEGLIPPGLDDEIPGETTSEDEGLSDEFAIPEMNVDDAEFTSDEFSFPEDMASPGDNPPPGDEFLSDEEFGTDDIESFESVEAAPPVGTEDTGLPEEPPSDSLVDDFSIPETIDGTDEFSGEEFELPTGDMAGIPEESVPAVEEEGMDEFSIPDDLAGDISGASDIPAVDEFALPEDFSIPGDIDKSSSIEKGLPEEFSIPEDFSQPFAEGTPAKSEGGEFETDILDEFSIPDEFKEPAKTEETTQEEEDEFVIDDFSLPGLDDDFDLDSIDKKPGETVQPPGDKEQKDEREKKTEGEEINLTENEFTAIQKTLETLPRNLKIITQDLIGQEKIRGKELNHLIGLLIKGASPSNIAAYVSKITGKKIVLPKSFEKKTGTEFAAEKKSFKYIFRENIIPILRVVVPAIILLIVIIFFVINYIVIPGHADSIYQMGLDYIEKENKIQLGDKTFNDAYRINPKDSWFYKYAEAYADKNEYNMAQQKYEQLLNLGWEKDEIKFLTNYDKKGIIDYANFESGRRFDHEKAEKLLNHLLDRDKFHKAALFSAGDNYLEWAKSDSSKYEDARLAYSKLRRTSANRQDIDFRFLKYFIRTDNFKEVEKIKNRYQANPTIKVDPVIYTELGGYLLDKDRPEDVRNILFRAMKRNEAIPELHYHLSRYFNTINKPDDEETALIKTLDYLKAYMPLTTERREIQSDTHNRMGKLFYKQNKIIDAEQQFQTSIKIIEDNQKNNILGRKPQYGEVYANLGDIYYYKAEDFKTAKGLYEKAASNFYETPDLNYKKGYIDYENKDYLPALLNFYKSEEGSGSNTNLLYSIANTLYYRNDHYAAQGYYTHLLNKLKKKRDSLPSFRPEDTPSHRSLGDYMLRTYNNLAVTIKKLSESPINPAKETEALVYLTKSSEFYDILKRLTFSPETMTRDKQTRNIAYLNQRQILYPQKNYELELYRELPMDTETGDFKDSIFSIDIN